MHQEIGFEQRFEEAPRRPGYILYTAMAGLVAGTILFNLIKPSAGDESTSSGFVGDPISCALTVEELVNPDNIASLSVYTDNREVYSWRDGDGTTVDLSILEDLIPGRSIVSVGVLGLEDQSLPATMFARAGINGEFDTICLQK